MSPRSSLGTIEGHASIRQEYLLSSIESIALVGGNSWTSMYPVGGRVERRSAAATVYCLLLVYSVQERLTFTPYGMHAGHGIPTTREDRTLRAFSVVRTA